MTAVRLLQPWKALLPMLVTLLGMVTAVRLLQPLRALSPILVTSLGIMVFLHPVINLLDDVSIITLQLLRESYILFPDSTLIDVRPLQLEKALSPMLVTLLGMVTAVRPLQS